MTALLEAIGVRKTFGALVALDGVDFRVMSRQRHGLIGPNGSGKSTLLRLIAGEYRADRGRIELDATDVSRTGPAERARLGIAIKFQIPSVFGDLSVYDNVLLAAQRDSSWAGLVRSSPAAALRPAVWAVLDRFGLTSRAGDRAAVLSHGEKQWLEIAIASTSNPRLLLLDEPTAGMSPEERRHTGSLLRQLSCTIVIVEHDLDFVRNLCDTITVLDRGQVTASGSPAEIQQSDRVKDIYLTRAGGGA